MDQARLGEALYYLQHRHADGSWETLERRPSAHDPAALDPEASWVEGEVYACPSCDEQVVVRYPTLASGTHPGDG